MFGCVIAETFENYSVWEGRKLMSLMMSGVMGKAMHWGQKCCAYRLGAIMVYQQVCCSLFAMLSVL